MLSFVWYDLNAYTHLFVDGLYALPLAINKNRSRKEYRIKPSINVREHWTPQNEDDTDKRIEKPQTKDDKKTM